MTGTVFTNLVGTQNARQYAVTQAQLNAIISALPLPGLSGNAFTFDVLSAPPANPQVGMVVNADGVNWNPGNGAGLYAYVSGTWVFLGGGSAISPDSNIVINSGMEVSQYFGSASQTYTASGAIVKGYSVDAYAHDGKGTFVLTIQQVSDAPPGFVNSIKMAVTTGESPLGAADGFGFYQQIEGTRFSRLAFGTPSASTVTLSFWAKAHQTGAYPCSFKSSFATSRSYPFSYTISAADTWQFFSFIIPGDTGGSWVTGPAISAFTQFSLGLGSTPSGGTPNVWQNGNFDGVPGIVNALASASDYLQISGVSLVPGSVLVTPAASCLFKRDYAENLILACRYLWVIQEGTFAQGIVNFGQAFNTTSAFIMLTAPVPFMKAPSVSVSSPSDFNLIAADASALPVTSLGNLSWAAGRNEGAQNFNAAAGGLVAGNGTGLAVANTNARIYIDGRM